MRNILRSILGEMPDEAAADPAPIPQRAEDWWRQRLKADIEEAAALYASDDATQLALIAEILGAAMPAAAPAPTADTEAPPDAAAVPEADLLSALDTIRDELRTALAKADCSGELIDRLDRENRALRTREDERRLRGVLKSFIPIFDDLRAVRLAAPDETRANFAAFEAQALEHLRRHGLDEFEPAPGEPFDSRRAEAVARIETGDAAAEMTVAEVVRLGFEHGDNVVRPAAVKVYRHVSPDPAACPTGEETAIQGA